MWTFLPRAHSAILPAVNRVKELLRMGIWLVCGGRTLNDREYIWSVLDNCVIQFGAPTLLISGGAPGVDTQASAWAYGHKLPRKVFAADWQKYGRAAGMLRNQEMLNFGPRLVIAFPGGRGTNDMVRRAEEAGLEILLV